MNSDNMKKVLILLILLICTGCTIVRIDTKNLDNVTNVILSKDNKLFNRIGKGFKYYVPRGVFYIDSNGFNEKLYASGNYYYLFVDAISYFHNKDTFCAFDDNAIYTKEINSNEKKGCLQVNKINDDYFIRFFYNYARIETTVSEKDLGKAVLDSSYILSTVKFNDIIIKTYLDEDYFNQESVYDKFESNTDIDNFYRGENEKGGD